MSKEYLPKSILYSKRMGNAHILELFARNLQAAIERKYGLKPDGTVNQSALARDSKVAQKGISNYLSANKPENRPHLDDIPSPSIDILAKLAAALGVEPWELLHPDLDRARREHEFYQRLERDFAKLPPLEAEPIRVPTAERSPGRREMDYSLRGLKKPIK